MRRGVTTGKGSILFCIIYTMLPLRYADVIHLLFSDVLCSDKWCYTRLTDFLGMSFSTLLTVISPTLLQCSGYISILKYTIACCTIVPLPPTE